MTRALKLRRAFASVLCCSVAVLLAGCGGGSHARRAEERTESAYNLARGNPLALRAFLVDMPKGGELHYHLVGGIYAETYIRDGAEDHMCVDLASRSLVKTTSKTCAKDSVPAEQAFQDQHLYDELVDAFSMRGFVPTPGVTGHDQFFNTFARFSAIDSRHTGEWLDEAATRAASQNEQYMEVMVTPPFGHAATIAHEIGWHPDAGFAAFRDQLLAKGLRDEIVTTKAYLNQAEASRRNWSIVATRTKLRLATSRFATSIRCCGRFRRNRCSRKLFWDSRRLRPIRASWGSITCSRKTITRRWRITSCK